MEFQELLIGLIVILLAAKIGGELMERLGQTAVLGELLAGVVIGPGVFGTGLVRLPQMMKAGFWLNLAGILVITALAALFIAPVLGNVY